MEFFGQLIIYSAALPHVLSQILRSILDASRSFLNSPNIDNEGVPGHRMPHLGKPILGDVLTVNQHMLMVVLNDRHPGAYFIALPSQFLQEGMPTPSMGIEIIEGRPLAITQSNGQELRGLHMQEGLGNDTFILSTP
jgi:hypothetical protein